MDCVLKTFLLGMKSVQKALKTRILLHSQQTGGFMTSFYDLVTYQIKRTGHPHHDPGSGLYITICLGLKSGFCGIIICVAHKCFRIKNIYFSSIVDSF